MSKCNKKYRGFSLVEMLVALAIFSAISLILATFLSQSLKSYRIRSEESEEQEKASHIMREFEKMTRAGTRVIVANQNELKFYRYFDLTSSSPTQIRYFIDGNQFKIGQTEPVGVEPNISYPLSAETIHLIVEDVENPNMIFEYFDGEKNSLALPIDTTKIRLIKLTISLDQDTNKPPAAVTETTEVSLRNLKDNL
jgi:prepilin-type N-terminal cleavage/methylation domain-containing protein